MPRTKDRLIYWTDSEGRAQLIEVTDAVARLLARAEPALRESLFDKPEALDQIACEASRDEASLWDEPHWQFTWLLGESSIWSGAISLWESVWSERQQVYVWRCRFCKGRKLPACAYCLNCDRSGRDREMQRIARPEPSARRSMKQDGLRGGL